MLVQLYQRPGKLFEDNIGAITLAQDQTMNPEDMLTHPLNEYTFILQTLHTWCINAHDIQVYKETTCQGCKEDRVIPEGK